MKMKYLKFGLFAFVLLLGSLFAAPDSDFTTNTVAVGGYDTVAYHTDGKAVRGSGDHVAVYQGATYLFANEANQKRFQSNPAKYAPAFGGYCAYGVAVGKKFVGDPEIWKVVDGVLYLNLNQKIQKTWNKDIPGNISKARSNWVKIKDKAPSEL